MPSANSKPLLWRILRIQEVQKITGRSRSSIYENVAQGRLAPPLKIGRRAIGWDEQSLIAHQQRLLAEREGGGRLGTAPHKPESNLAIVEANRATEKADQNRRKVQRFRPGATAPRRSPQGRKEATPWHKD